MKLFWGERGEKVIHFIHSALLPVVFCLFSLNASAGTAFSPSRNHILERYRSQFPRAEQDLNLKEKYQALLQKRYPQKEEARSATILADLMAPMIEREDQLSNQDFVFYFGAGFAGSFITELRRFVPPSEFHDIMTFTEEALAHTPDKIHFDRDPTARSNLKSVSISLASFGANESAADAFIEAKNINVNIDSLKTITTQLLKDRPTSQVQKILKLVDEYQGKIHRSMVQIFVKKDTIEKVAYISRPYGIPIKNINELEVLESFDHSLLDFRTYLHAHNIERRLNVYTENYSRAALTESGYEDYFQVRLLTTSPVFYDAEQTSVYFYYPPGEDLEGQKMRLDMQRILQ